MSLKLQHLTGLVAQGSGFCFVRAGYEPFRRPGVVFKRIEGDPLTVSTGIAALRDSCSRGTLSLIREPASELADHTALVATKERVA